MPIQKIEHSLSCKNAIFLEISQRALQISESREISLPTRDHMRQGLVRWEEFEHACQSTLSVNYIDNDSDPYQHIIIFMQQL